MNIPHTLTSPLDYFETRVPIKAIKLSCNSKQKDSSSNANIKETFFRDILQMEQQPTRKMLLKASIVHILKAQRYKWLINKHFTSIWHGIRFLLYFVTIAKNLYNVLMLKNPKVIELILELLVV